MSSDATYERLVKLWISLWNLVLENKRHLQTVCAALQKLVFEKQSWPRYKNWSEICKLGHFPEPGQHPLMMAVLATLDLENRNEVTEQIVAAFPQYFSDKPTKGPFPLSYIRRLGGELATRKQVSYLSGANLPVSHGVPEVLGIPEWWFGITPEATANYRIPPLPESIPADSKQGDIVEWEGKRVVVLEVNRNEDVDIMHIVPAELIDVNA